MFGNPSMKFNLMIRFEDRVKDKNKLHARYVKTVKDNVISRPSVASTIANDCAGC